MPKISFMKPAFFLCALFSLAGSALKVVSPKEDGSYLVMEQVDENNIDFWYSFAEQARVTQSAWMSVLSYIKGIIPEDKLNDRFKNRLEPLDEVEDEQLKDLIKNDSNPLVTLKKKYAILKDAADGISNFKNALGNAKNKMGDVWIAYISLLDPTKEASDPDRYNNIEMAVTILTKKDSPVSMHMGIFRNPAYLMSHKKQHPRISPELHAFAAKTSLTYYPTLRSMVTTPLASMANLLKGILPTDSFAEGMNKEGTWILRDIQASDPLPRTPYETGYRFELFDRDISDAQKELVLLIDDKNKEDYWWLVSRLHASLSQHPYFVVKLKDLASIFEGKSHVY